MATVELLNGMLLHSAHWSKDGLSNVYRSSMVTRILKIYDLKFLQFSLVIQNDSERMMSRVVIKNSKYRLYFPLFVILDAILFPFI